MEKAYKVALKTILGMCKEENYISTKNLILICETALKEDAREELNKAISEATSIANRGSNNV